MQGQHVHACWQEWACVLLPPCILHALRPLAVSRCRGCHARADQICKIRLHTAYPSFSVLNRQDVAEVAETSWKPNRSCRFHPAI
jgi:hypothetical protein